MKSSFPALPFLALLLIGSAAQAQLPMLGRSAPQSQPARAVPAAPLPAAPLTTAPQTAARTVPGTAAPAAPPPTAPRPTGAPPPTTVVRAQTPPDANSGNALLERVVATLDAQRSIAAKVRYRVDLLNKPMIGSGIYLQQGRGAERLLRLELNTQATEQIYAAKQVCDGTQLWISEEFGEHHNVSIVNVDRVRRARPKTPPSPPPANLWIALGGLPKLFDSVRENFTFNPPVEAALDDGRLNVWTLEGQWKPGRLAGLLPDQKGTIEAGGQVDLSKLAPNLPDRVLMHVGREDMFPYRIEYWRTNKPMSAAPASGTLVLVMELYEVQLGPALDPRSFSFQPSQHPPIDRTAAFLVRFGLEEAAGTGARTRLPPRR